VKNAREKLAARFGDSQIGGKGKHSVFRLRYSTLDPNPLLPKLLILIISLFRHPEKKEEAC
jgi:hypothetical protein